jgi:hypothetical protein
MKSLIVFSRWRSVRRAMIACAAFAAANPLAPAGMAGQVARQPNILLIMTDDRDKPGASEHQKQHKMTGFHAYFEKGASDKLSGNRVEFGGINYTLLHERLSCPPPKACGTLI